MGWNFTGSYFESCSCESVCPCAWSGFTAPATNERCHAVLIDRGEVEGVDVSGLSFGIVLDSPAIMIEGNWRLGFLLDAAADEPQAEKLGQVLAGELGGPPAVLAPLVAEMLGVERVPVDYREDGDTHTVRFGDLVDMETKDYVAGETAKPVQLTNILHPANTTLTLSPAIRTRVSVFGVEFDGTGTSGFSAPFAWST